MHIVIIDDEKILSESIKKKLLKNHYTVSLIHSYSDFLSMNTTGTIDLYIIDISLGDGTGFDIIKVLKQNKKTQYSPILLMSGHDDVATKVEGLDLGADDYIVKPFDYKELLARIRSLLRRKDLPLNQAIFSYKDYSFDLNKREVTKQGSIISLPKKEKQILEYFISRQDTLISKPIIIHSLWGDASSFATDNTLNVTICNLRKKLGSDFKLETVIGEGYILQN